MTVALLAALALAGAAAPADAPLPRERGAEWLRPVAHSAALLGGMRLGLAVLWPDPYDPSRLDGTGLRLRQAFTAPPELRRDRGFFSSDGDPWTINVVGHAMFGSEVFLRARQCGHGVVASLAASAVTSAAWEYAVESFQKRPSAVDLAWTPVAGALLGEARFRLHRWGRRDRRPLPRLLVWIADPLGEAERAAFGGC